LRIFPNPVENEINITLQTEKQSVVELERFTVTGKKYSSNQVNLFQSANPAGIYMLRIKVNEVDKDQGETQMVKIYKN
jgi:hypothetical protein